MRAARLLLLALAAAVLWGALRTAGAARLWDALAQADGRLVLLACAIGVGPRLWARVERTRSLLRALTAAPPPFLAVTRILLASYAASHVAPVLGAMALRVALLRRLLGGGLGAVALAYGAEKILDALSLGLIFLGALLLAAEPARRASAGPVGAALLLCCGALALGLRWARRRLRALAPALLLRAGALSLLTDASDVLMLALCLAAAGVWPGAPLCLLAFLAVNGVLALPVTPGQLGALEAAIVATLAAAGRDPARALAAAALYHLAHLSTLPLLAVLLLPRRRAHVPG